MRVYGDQGRPGRHHRVTFGLDDEQYGVVSAHARDRGLPVYEVARAALLNDARRSVGRSHVLDEVMAQIEALRAELEGLREIILPEASRSSEGPSALAEGKEGGGLKHD